MFTITRLDAPGGEPEPDITASNADELVDALEGRHGVFQITHESKRASLVMHGQPRGDKFVVEIYRLVEALTAPVDPPECEYPMCDERGFRKRYLTDDLGVLLCKRHDAVVHNDDQSDQDFWRWFVAMIDTRQG